MLQQAGDKRRGASEPAVCMDSHECEVVAETRYRYVLKIFRMAAALLQLIAEAVSGLENASSNGGPAGHTEGPPIPEQYVTEEHTKTHIATQKG